jgi:hypothetical protein
MAVRSDNEGSHLKPAVFSGWPLPQPEKSVLTFIFCSVAQCLQKHRLVNARPSVQRQGTGTCRANCAIRSKSIRGFSL